MARQFLVHGTQEFVPAGSLHQPQHRSHQCQARRWQVNVWTIRTTLLVKPP